MAIPVIPKGHFWCALLFLLSTQAKVWCYTYKVGDLDGWGIPSSSNSDVYDKWSKNHNVNVGDSLFFLYPPSQDSVIQVTKDSYDNCNLKNPVLHMNNGNSLFNITRPGNYYFTSGVDGHCQKSQKLHVLASGNGSFYEAVSPAYGPDASAPSYPTVFGAIPVQASSSPAFKVSLVVSAAAGLLISLCL